MSESVHGDPVKDISMSEFLEQVKRVNTSNNLANLNEKLLKDLVRAVGHLKVELDFFHSKTQAQIVGGVKSQIRSVKNNASLHC